VDGPTYDSPTVGVVDAVRKVPYLELIASRSADGDRLVLAAISKHFSRPIRASIAVDAFEPAGKGRRTTLTGRGIDANTGTQLLQIPGFTWGKQTSVPPARRIDHGGPGEIDVQNSTMDAVGRQFELTLPPLSLTIVELSAKR
jgi:hypothetical protein